jgi:predicted phage tail protein
MKTKIILHGKLAKIYGKEFEFANIKKPIDAVIAIETRFPGFRDFIIDSSKKGAHYEIICDNESEDAFSINNKKQKIQQIQIVPCILGSGPAVFIVLGAIAVGVAVYGGVSAVAAAFFITLGLGLIMAGIMYLLTPIPENEPSSEISASVKNSSFMFQSPQNISTQGRSIPICYGKLRVGSYVVGTTISNYNLESDPSSQNRFKSNRSNSILKIQKSFGSSVSNLYRFL